MAATSPPQGPLSRELTRPPVPSQLNPVCEAWARRAIGRACSSRSAQTWATLPGLAVAGIRSGVANAALGRPAVESAPRNRAAPGNGADNTARYLGGAAGVAPVVAIGTGADAGGVIRGRDTAALASASLCALIAGCCRTKA